MSKAEELSKACSPSSENQSYKYTVGWLDGFKKRYHVRLRDSLPSKPFTVTSRGSGSHSVSSVEETPDIKPLHGFFLPPPNI